MAKAILVNINAGTNEARLRISGNDITYSGIGAAGAEANTFSACTKNWLWVELPPEYVKTTSEPIFIKGSVAIEPFYTEVEGGPTYTSGMIPFIIGANHIAQFFEANPNYPFTAIPYIPEVPLADGVFAYQFVSKQANTEFTMYAVYEGSSVETLIGLEYGTIALSETVPNTGVYCRLTKTEETPSEINTTYDYISQSLTVTGLAGVEVTTKDPNNNVIGTGVIGETGSVTYKLDEGSLPNNVTITTAGNLTNSVENQLLTSSKFIYAPTTANYEGGIGTYMNNTNINGRLAIDWGDGSAVEFYQYDDAADNWGEWYGHTYVNPGEYVMKVRAEGQWEQLEVNDHHKLLDWGNVADYTIGNASSAFTEVVPTTLSELITDCSFMFQSCSNFNQNLEHWDMSKVTSIKGMFAGCSNYNQPLNGWNLINVTDMTKALSRCSIFNQPLNNWKVDNVIAMANFAEYTTAFNQDLSGWCVSKILTQPTNFAINSALTPEHYPVWGTCPNGPST